jgi:hypothetical protein
VEGQEVSGKRPESDGIYETKAVSQMQGGKEKGWEGGRTGRRQASGQGGREGLREGGFQPRLFKEVMNPP